MAGVRRKPTQEQLKRERLKELVYSNSWPILEEWVSERIVELYKRLRAGRKSDYDRITGELDFAERLLGLKKGLRSDDVVGKSLSQEED